MHLSCCFSTRKKADSRKSNIHRGHVHWGLSLCWKPLPTNPPIPSRNNSCRSSCILLLALAWKFWRTSSNFFLDEFFQRKRRLAFLQSTQNEGFIKAFTSFQTSKGGNHSQITFWSVIGSPINHKQGLLHT